MTDDELGKALEGLFAADTGQTNGISDPELRERVIAELNTPDQLELILLRLSRIVRETYLSERSLERGYSIQDVAEFLYWLSTRMDFDVF